MTATQDQTSKAAPWPRRGGIWKIAPSGPWFVPSRSERGCFRRVDWDTDHGHIMFTCTCPSGRSRGHMGVAASSPCWHVREVSWAEQEDGFNRRPVGLVGDTGRFVD